jgi:tight adherence protein B
VSAVLAALGLAILLWVRPRAQGRAHELIPAERVRPTLRADRLGVGLALGPVLALVFAGASAALAATMAAGMAQVMLVSQRRERAGAAEMARLLAALEVMVAELRVGAHPAHACRQAADDCSGAAGAGTAEMLQMMAGRAALGGDVAAGIEQARGHVGDSAAGSGSAAGFAAWQRVAVAWRTAERYGLPMAELLTSVRADLLARHRFKVRTTAALAGAKATALVLALLPILGIVLGQAMGAAPLSVLLGGGLGGVLLVIGVGLVCAGLLWSRRIVGKVTDR